MEQAEQACAQLSRPPGHPAVGAAWYRVAELQRLRGQLARAEDAYRSASAHGCDPQPGLAMLRLAQGRPAAAAAAIRRAFGEAVDRLAQTRLLLAYVEIMLAVGEIDAARVAMAGVPSVDGDWEAPALQAIAAHAAGLVLLAEGDPRAALTSLRPAWTTWRALEAPYEAAKVRVAFGLACRQLGDDDGATLEFDAAAAAFRALGAAADLAALEQLSSPGPTDAAGLSPRERQVLALVATGMTNRSIAAELVISQKTVARHVANIFNKLGTSSRSAATAYAYEHGLTRSVYTQ
jgi:DNA-binding CsgD family transcriptional regulator